MNLSPIFGIDRSEAEAFYNLLLAVEYSDRKATASSLLRRVRDYLREDCGEVERWLEIEDHRFDHPDGMQTLAGDLLSRIGSPHLRRLVLPFSRSIAESGTMTPATRELLRRIDRDLRGGGEGTARGGKKLSAEARNVSPRLRLRSLLSASCRLSLLFWVLVGL
jgi:hypothetical protein